MCEEQISRPIDERRAKLCEPLHNTFPSYQVYCTSPIYLFVTRRASLCLREGGEIEGIKLSLTSNLNALAVPLKHWSVYHVFSTRHDATDIIGGQIFQTLSVSSAFFLRNATNLCSAPLLSISRTDSMAQTGARVEYDPKL
jgi:hypothetical protein